MHAVSIQTKEGENEVIVFPLQRLWELLFDVALTCKSFFGEWECSNKECSESFMSLFLPVWKWHTWKSERIMRNRSSRFGFTYLGVFLVVAQPRFTRLPAWPFHESWQFVGDILVSLGPCPQIQVVVELKEAKPRLKSTYNQTLHLPYLINANVRIGAMINLEWKGFRFHELLQYFAKLNTFFRVVNRTASGWIVEVIKVKSDNFSFCCQIVALASYF